MGEIIMPKMGDAMTEGKVVRWYKKAGDTLKVGEPVLEIETDKVNLDLEAEENGILGEIEVADGSTVEVGKRLALVRVAGEKEAPKETPKDAGGGKKDAPAEKAKSATTKSDGTGKPVEAAKSAETAKPTETTKPAEASRSAAQPAKGSDEKKPAAAEGPAASDAARPRSSPLARKLAKDLGVDLAAVNGSGPSGRIVAADIRSQAEATPEPKDRSKAPAPKSTGKALPAMESKEIPLTAMRRTIAKRLAESLGPVPHFFLTIDTDVTSLLALRSQLNEIEGSKVSVNDFVIRAAALAIRQHPLVNSSFGADAIQQHGEIHIGIAVATPEGLITPVVRNADSRSVIEIASGVRELADRARNRKLRPEEYQGSTFTISNLGMYGIDEFTAIINPPNVAILAIGVAGPQPTVAGGVVVIRDRMKITMSCDHRVVDGAAGADYLRTLRQYIEQPLRLLL